MKQKHKMAGRSACLRLSKKLSFRASAHTGVAIRSPKHSDFILMFRKTAALKVRIPTVASLPRNDREFFDTPSDRSTL